MGQIPPQATIRLPERYKAKYRKTEAEVKESMATTDERAAKWYESFDKALAKATEECAKIEKGEPSNFTVDSVRSRFDTTKLENVVDKLSNAIRYSGDQWEMMFPEFNSTQLKYKADDYKIAQYKKVIARAKKDLASVEEMYKKSKEIGSRVEKETPKKEEPKKEEPKKDEPKKEEPKKDEPSLTPEQKKEKALEEVDTFIGKNAMNIRQIFKFGAGREYLGDKEIVLAIIQKYPQSIDGLTNSYMAKNFEDVTKSFVLGVVDICQEPRKSGERFIGGPVTSGRNGELFAIEDKTYVETILSDARNSYRSKVDDMTKEAISIVEKDKEENGDKSKFKDVDVKNLYVVEQKGSSEFPDRINDIEKQAKGATEILIGEEREF